MHEKMLLVDDHQRSRNNIAYFLRGEGFEVHEMPNGNEAAQLLEKVRFDLVVSDLCMPGLDGFRLVECARSLSPNIPIVLMSGRANANLDQVDDKSGLTEFIEKPINLEELLSKVRQALSTKN
jgi:two-component system, NtrC family, nitrogen regulation response regulator NtrX